MGLPWHNSSSEMFVNLNIKSFGELLRVSVHGSVACPEIRKGGRKSERLFFCF